MIVELRTVVVLGVPPHVELAPGEQIVNVEKYRDQYFVHIARTVGLP